MATSGWAEHVAVGPFDAWLGDQPGANYAAPRLPLPNDGVVRRALVDLAALFAARGKPLMLELTEPLFPELPRLIGAAGIPVVGREPILICPAADFRPHRSSGVSVRFLQPDDPDADLAALVGVYNGVFERGSSLEALRSELARYDNAVVEITRVGTAAWARRRGVAASLTSFMVEDAIATGHDLAWLTASGPPAQSLYQRLGFRIVGDRIYYEAPLG